MPPLGAVKIANAIFTGDKTMASVSLQSRLTLNCKLSGRTKSGSALTVGIVQVQRSRKVAPSGGSKHCAAMFTGDKTRLAAQAASADKRAKPVSRRLENKKEIILLPQGSRMKFLCQRCFRAHGSRLQWSNPS